MRHVRPVRWALKVVFFTFLGGYRIEDAVEKVTCSPRLWLFRPRGLAIRILAPFRRSNLIFIHIPKNAGTSITHALYGQKIHHYSAGFYRTLDPNFYANTISFAVLRDPVDRFLSGYFFIMNGGGSSNGLDVLWRRIYADKTDDLDAFIDIQTTLSRRFKKLDYVMRPQSDFITDATGKIIVDRIFVLGRHDAELRRFLATYGIATLPMLNQTARHHISVSKRQEQAIRDVYKADVELLERVSASPELGWAAEA